MGKNNGIHESGFTLLETMIAMTIMLVAFSAILMIESNSLNSAAKSRQMNVVAMLAKNIMVETELKLEGRIFSEIKKEDTGDFKEPYQEYKWKREIKEVKFPNLNMAGKKQEGGDENADEGSGSNSLAETLTKLLTNFLSNAIREVVVTISWKKGSGEQSFTVATYWVNLNNEFSLRE